MKNLNHLLFFTFLILSLLMNYSCSDNEVSEYQSKYTTIFRVYESNDNFSEEKSASARYVSEGAIITIWELNDNNGYNMVQQLKTGLDGIAKYAHNDEIIFYTVDKNIDTDENTTIRKSNLIRLNLVDENGAIVNAAKFQVAGVYTSIEDIEANSQFNFGVRKEEYNPQIGSIKFKDINGDGYIDIEDSISKSMIDKFWKDEEEVVYIAPTE